jgi:hypothetical protein
VRRWVDAEEWVLRFSWARLGRFGVVGGLVGLLGWRAVGFGRGGGGLLSARLARGCVARLVPSAAVLWCFVGLGVRLGLGLGCRGMWLGLIRGLMVLGVSVPRVERFDGSGMFGSSVMVDVSSYQILGPIAVDSGVGGGVYVAASDVATGAAVVLKSAGVFEYALNAGSGPVINPGAVIAVDPVDASMFVTATATDNNDPDSPVQSQMIDRFDRSTGVLVDSFAGSFGGSGIGGGFGCPSGLGVDVAHRVFVLDPCTGRVDRYSAAGVFGVTVDDVTRGLGGSGAVAVDPVSGLVYVAELGAAGWQVAYFTAAGTVIGQTFGVPDIGGFSGMAVGLDGTIYLADSANSVIERFTLFEGPTVLTTAASGVAPTTATLNATIDPEGVAASYRFEYALDTTYGTSTPDTVAGGGTGAVPASAVIDELVPNTTYHYRVIGFNSSGSIVGNDQSLTTTSIPPLVGGAPSFVSSITPSTARVHGTINPQNTETAFHVEYGTTTGYGQESTAGAAGHALADTPVSIDLDGLQPATLYHYRVTANNGAGGTQYGVDGTFITAPGALPTASDLTTVKATLTGTINLQGATTSFHFDYGPTTSYGVSTPEVTAGSGNGEQTVSQAIDGLSAARTYHVRVVATSSNGVIRSGADGTFRTPSGPTAATSDTTNITLNAAASTSSATLAGSTDTHGLPGTYRFEVASLDSAYAYTTSDQAVPNGGNGVQQVSRSVTHLPSDESFRVRLVVSSNDATGYSDLFTFTTPAPPRFFPSPPAPAVVYGCTSPVLNPYNSHPKPGEPVTITGTGLGVGGNVVLGDQSLVPDDWSQDGFTIQIPNDATGTMALTVNCGQTTNTIAIAIYQQPNNAFTITKQANTGTTVTVTVPGPHKLQGTATHTKPVTATITKAGTTTIDIRLNTAGTSALKKATRHKLNITARIRYAPAGGQPNTTTLAYTQKGGH